MCQEQRIINIFLLGAIEIRIFEPYINIHKDAGNKSILIIVRKGD